MLFGDKNCCDNNYLLNVNYLPSINELSNKKQYFQVSKHLLYYYR